MPISILSKRGILAKWLNYSNMEVRDFHNHYDIYRPRYFKLPYSGFIKWEWYFYMQAVLRLIVASKLKVDMIHSHGLIPDAYAAIEIGRRLNLPVVVHVHDSYLVENIFPNYEKKIRKIFDYAARIIAVSDFQKRNIIACCPSAIKKIRVVHNGIDDKRFCLSRTASVNQNKLVYVGNIIELKRVDILIRSISHLQKKCQLRLDIIGDGPELNKCRLLANDLGVSHAIVFRGQLLNQDIQEELKNYNLFVSASIHETFGIALIEALACGIPVVAFNVGAIAEILSSQQFGLLVEKQNSIDFAEAIERALHTNWDNERISQVIRSRYSLRRTAETLSQIYDEI